MESSLDFDQVRKAVYQKAWCEEGRGLLESQDFFMSPIELDLELDIVSEIKDILAGGDSFSDVAFVKVSDILVVLSTEGNVLDESQLARLYYLLKGSHELVRFFTKKDRVATFPNITGMFSAVKVDKKWYTEIDRILDLETKTVKSNASEELIRIRTKMSKLRKQKDSAFIKTLKEFQNAGYLDDQKESWREGRRVLAVLSEHKRLIQGIVLDISGNGNITFIEPSTVMPFEAELSEYRIQEQKEIRRILLHASLELSPHRADFEELSRLIAQLDAWQAKSGLSIQMNGTRPEISADKIDLRQARHPILEKHLSATDKKLVALDANIDEKNRILVISGPNAGGKSIAMKTVGLHLLMAQFGLHIPALEGSCVRLFRQVMVDIGDDQSIEDDLSTYSSHIVKMSNFLDHADAHTFFIIDEMGSGTDPAFGGPIAEAILESLAAKKAYGIVTTHYSNLKEMAQRTDGVLNGAMSFDLKSLSPTFELLTGQAGASYALEVAGRSGLPESILKIAESKMGGEQGNVERSLTQIQNEKLYLKGIRKSSQKRSQYLEKLVADYENLKTHLEKNKKKLIRQYEEKLLADYNKANRELENTIREAKKSTVSASTEKAKEVRKKLDVDRRKMATKIQATDAPVFHENEAEIEIGSEVRLEGSPRVGKVLEIRKGKANVQFGPLMTTVPVAKLIHCHAEKVVKKTKRTTNTPNTIVEKSKFDLELDLRGKYKGEAIQEVEQFLDRAVMFGIDRVRIIHGRGTGVLRQTVQQVLKQYPFVSNFKHEEQEGGGDGVTIVELE
ncbi:MAG: hypothetical protein GY751_17525 [Bacteroidetes bacterium]|nr:hypothetical protein [Bacteroidota bacterium]